MPVNVVSTNLPALTVTPPNKLRQGLIGQSVAVHIPEPTNSVISAVSDRVHLYCLCGGSLHMRSRRGQRSHCGEKT